MFVFELIAWLSGLLYGNDVGRLASPSYECRERAEKGLKAAGWRAFPALDAARKGTASPEVRCRVSRLLYGMDRQLAYLGAWRVVLAPDEPDYPAIWQDVELRRLLGLIGRDVRSQWWDWLPVGKDRCVPMFPPWFDFWEALTALRKTVRGAAQPQLYP